MERPVFGLDYRSILDGMSSIVNDIDFTIGNFSRFNDRMYFVMTSLMQINRLEKDTTLNMISGSQNQASPNSKHITNEAQRPGYVYGNNYVDAVNNLYYMSDYTGSHTTRRRASQSLMDEGGDNLYPNQLDSSDDYIAGRSWNVYTEDEWADKNSILYKTKRLFQDRKIGTLIEQFGTNTDGGGSEYTQAGDVGTDAYGMSKGRNLLIKAAETKGGKYPDRGYNNPYCRVWTYFHKYNTTKDLIRPFRTEGGESTQDLKSKVHSWNADGDKKWWESESSKPESKTDKSSTGEYMWKDGKSARWDLSVLHNHSDGLVNITPKYNSGDSIHTKDCMFSIENLAWKDYNPYKFDKNLSWEQRGPNGGRIMWFPPYGLEFSETTSAQWNANQFIGRGEDVYTYINTRRSGNLSFLLLVDHPSVTDYATWYNGEKGFNMGAGILNESDILRYFAGCDPADASNGDKQNVNNLNSFTRPTPKKHEEECTSPSGKESKKEPIPGEPDNKTHTKEETIEFCVYYPNNYSGNFDCDDSEVGGVEFVINYLLAGRNAQEGFILEQPSNIPVRHIIPIDYNNAIGYEIGSVGITDEIWEDQVNNQTVIGNKKPWSQTGSKYMPDETKLWYYRIDGKYEVAKSTSMGGNNIYSNTYDQHLTVKANYKDTTSFRLNTSLDNQVNVYGGQIPDNAYTFSEVAEAFSPWWSSDFGKTASFFKNSSSINNNSGRVGYLDSLFREGKLAKIECIGYSNSHGQNASQTINAKRNEILATKRAETIMRWLKMNSDWADVETEISHKSAQFVENEPKNNPDATSLEAKIYRMAKCVLTFQVDETETLEESSEEMKTNPEIKDELENNLSNDVSSGGEVNEDLVSEVSITDSEYDDKKWNKLRYDQEFFFFKKFKNEHPIAYQKLMDKLQYFNPAFHSMTPEGFNSRLTFLNQCTRAGETISASDQHRQSASNMAFGRPPFCVLRVGDFYNQMIVINQIHIDYNVSEGLMWDLNDEGAGVQPMLAKVTIDFNFIGGGSLGGAIRRLQNAMTFNYYANTELYDNRADQVSYNIDLDVAVGGGEGYGIIDPEESKFRNVMLRN